MKNGNIEIDHNGKKWVWINCAFYEYDEQLDKEIKKYGLGKFINNNSKEIYDIFTGMIEVLKKINKK